MIGKVIFVVIINVLLVFAFLRYVPVTGILQQRGFSQEQIQALLTSTAEEPITAESVMLPSSAPQQQTAEPAAVEATTKPPPGKPANEPAPPRAGPANKTPAPPKPLPHRVATADVNIRTGQGTDSQAVGQVAEGDTVVVLDDPAGGDWMRIRYQNVEGWVYAPLFEAR